MVITNTGNVTIDNVGVTDNLVDLSAITPVESINSDNKLQVGETWTYTYTYDVTQADVDRGVVKNAVTVTGDDPSGNPVPPADDEVQVPNDQTPSMTVTKTSDKIELVAGETITYTVVITNTGNVTIDNVGVTDNLVDLFSHHTCRVH